MDDFGSPIAGGIRAVRRSVSSSVFRPMQRQEPVQAKPDPITTNLLSQNSLALTSISQQLQTVSSQVASLNFSLNGIKENLAVSDNLERQREAARRNRERILAEQGLREGKEGTLERKIQTALTSPLRRVAAKTRGILARLQDFFLIIAGGWLTASGIDLLQAMSEGNIDKINEYKNKFLKGLLVIGGAFTALQVGIGVTINLLSRFVGTVARVAFGGILRGAFRGVRRLISGVIGQIIGGGLGGFLGGAATGATTGAVAGASGTVVTTSIAEEIKTFREPRKITKKFVDSADDVAKSIGSGDPKLLKDVKPKNFFGKSVDKIKKFFGSKTTATGGKTVAKQVAKTGAKKGIASFLKGAAGRLLGKLGGPFLTFIIDLASGESVDNAIAGAAGFAAGAAIGQALIPIPIVGALIGGLVGEFALKRLYKGIKFLFGRLFGFNKKEENIRELKTEDLVSSDSDEGVEESITPVAKNNSEVATNISEVNEGKPTVVNIPMLQSNQSPQVAMSGDDSSKSNPIPSINFDNNNPHTLFATATYGV